RLEERLRRAECPERADRRALARETAERLVAARQEHEREHAHDHARAAEAGGHDPDCRPRPVLLHHLGGRLRAHLRCGGGSIPSKTFFSFWTACISSFVSLPSATTTRSASSTK